MKKLITLLIVILGLSINSFAYITITNDITSNTTWTSGNTYFISGLIYIDNSTLTIEDGVVVKSDGYLVSNNGTLQVNGQSTSPVIFTSMNDNTVGELIVGSSGNPAPNDWVGIKIDNDNTSTLGGDAHISYADFRYGQFIEFDDSPFDSDLNHISIHHFYGYGLELYSTNVTIDHIDISHCANALHIGGASASSLTNVTIEEIANPVIISFHGSDLTTIASWNIVAREDQYIRLRGSVFNGSNIPYLPGLVYVIPDGMLSFDLNNVSIEPGVILKLDGLGIDVDSGLLDINGTRDMPVIITSLKDDEFGGDTNGDGDASVPEKGDWNGIRIRGYASYLPSTTIDWTWIRYAGSQDGWEIQLTPAIEIKNTNNSSYIKNTRLEHIGYYGINVENCSPIIQNTSFLDIDSTHIAINGTANPNIGANFNYGMNVFRNTDFYDITNATTNGISAMYNDWGTMDSTAISQRVGNNDPSTGLINFTPIYNDEDVYWHTFTKAEIENAGVYNQLALDYEDIPTGTTILYQTGEGRYGKMNILTRSITTMALRWETYNSDGTTYSAGNNLIVGGAGDTDLCDLDRGIRGTYLNEQNDAEFYINADGSLLNIGNTKFLIGYSYCSYVNHSGTTSNNVTWGEGTHYITGDYTVSGGDTLFVEPGAVVKFSENTDLKVDGVIIALGTENDSIYFTSANDNRYGCIIDGSTGNPQPEDWGHITHTGYYEKHGEYRFCRMAYGGDGQAALLNYNYATGFFKRSVIEYSSETGLRPYQSNIEVDSCTFQNNLNYGIEYIYYSYADVSNSNFWNNGNYPVVLSGANVSEPLINNNSAGNLVEGILIIGLTSGVNQHLSNKWSMQGGIPFVVNSNLYTTSTLYIHEGCLIKFNPNAKVQVGNGGHINAFAAHLTSIKDDSKGGDTNNDGDATTPAPGDWNYIQIQYDKEAYISQCFIDYAGSSSAAVVFEQGAGGTLNNTYIKYSLNHGVKTSNAPLDIWACHITDNVKSGINLYSNDSTIIRNSYLNNNGEHGIDVTYSSPVEISGNEMLNNAQYPIYIYGSSTLQSPITANELDGNLLDGVVIQGFDSYDKQQFFEITGTSTSIKYPYVFLSSTNIYSTVDTLEFNAGAIVKLSDQKYLQTKGAILADGAIFTSIHDDTFGGDTENDGAATSPAKGDWSYIGVDAGGIANLNNCTIRYGGYNNYSSVRYYSNSSGFIKNSTVEFGFQDGISKYYEGNVEISNNVISDNDRYGINISSNQDTLIINGNQILNSGSHAIYLLSTISTDINNNAFDDNGGYPVYYTGTSTINDIFTGNTSSGNLMEGFAINSINGYSHNIFHPQNDLPFIFLNNITSYSTADTLEIKSSAVIKMFPGVKLEFRGPVITNGGLMTSIKDDAWGGDTNNDGDATVATPGDWAGLEIYNSWGEINGIVVRYAGANNYPGIHFNTSKGYISAFVDSCALDGIYLYNGSNVEVENTNLVGNARYGINVNSVDTVTIYNTTLQGNGSHGIYNSYAAPDLDNLTFTNNGGYPVYFATNSIIDKEFTGNTSSGNFMEGFTISTFNGYAHNILYHQENLPFIFPNSIIAYATADTFQIEQATCKFLPNVEIEFRGPVITNGGVFTSIKDDEWDGDTNNDEMDSNPAPGDWRGIEVYNTRGVFNDTKFRYGGAGSTPTLYLNGSNAYVDVSIDSSAYSGIYLYNADNVLVENSEFIGNELYGININSVDTCQISNSTFQGNGSHGIYISYAGPDIDNNTFTNNGDYPVYFTTNSIINKQFTGNTSSGNLMEGFAINDFNDYAHNILYHQENIPFIFPNNILSYATADTFQIEQATLKFLPDVELELRGPVITHGGVLTSIKDDVWDGDSNNDGVSTNPAPGDWRGLELYNTRGKFNGTNFRYGGASSSPALYFNTSNGYVDVTIESSANDGLYLYNANNVEVENSNIFGNTHYGINVSSVDDLQILNSTISENGSYGLNLTYSNAMLRGNTISNNISYGIYNASSTISLNLGNNNVNDKGENILTGNDGGNYQFYNDSPNEVNAYFNDWGFNTAAEIDAHIYDNDEDAAKGEVHFNPWYVFNLAVDVKAILEGPFNGTDMNTNLNAQGLLTLAQPFNVAPWNYSGNESVATIPNLDVVDWVLLELRDATDASSAGSGTIIDSQAGFILKNGDIVSVDGTSILAFAANVSQNLFVVVHHRNHLEMMSANALTQSAGAYTYDFTTAISQAYQSGQKLVEGKAVIYGGDANADGGINIEDASIWLNEVGTSGYLNSDVTLDGQADNKDKNDIWVPNNNENSKVPE
jgi:parallel beta-helix repeat protein